jgi:predicted ATPase/DNA-binding CsgD family transcriptional regulator
MSTSYGAEDKDVTYRKNGFKDGDCFPPASFCVKIMALIGIRALELGESLTMVVKNWQDPHEGLSKREVEILHLLAAGMSDREIAEHLVMTVNTIKWYNRQIYSTLGVGSRTQAIARARDLQLLDKDDGTQAALQVVHSPPKHNLPVETTHFIGRRHEMEAIMRLLDTAHLLTLVGPPGTGKTRLALQVAGNMVEAFQEGVYFVSLAPISNPALVTNAVASAIGVLEVHGQPLIETLKHALHESQMLLILDNFEHLLPAAAQVSELLSAAPHLKVLATSREPLHLYSEQEYVVPPLELPDPEHLDPQALADCESTALFVQRARALRADFEVSAENALEIAKICVRLEGLPLAIELAAARIKLLTPRTLLDRLTSRLDTLTGGAHDLPARQQTLRNTIEWSYNLLDEGEKVLFERLSVFAGGWSLEAAEFVCGDNLPVTVLDGLASLMDKSLIQQAGEDFIEPRFTMLETIRDYALERLKEGKQEEALRVRHAAYYIAFAESTGFELYSRYRSAGLTHFELEQNNFRAVLSWSLAGDPEPGLRLISALGICWRIRNYLVEGFNWAQRLLEKGVNVAPEVRANALSSASRLLVCSLGNYAEAERMSREALDLARKSGDRNSIAHALYARGAALMETNVGEARLFLDEALALLQSLNDPWRIAQLLNIKGEVARLQGDNEAAEQLYQQALTLYRQVGDPWGANIVLQNLAYIAQRQNDYEREKGLFAESLRTSQELNDRMSVANCLVGLAGIFANQGQRQRAVQLFSAAEALRDSLGVKIPPGDRPDYKANLALIRSGLDENTFETYWNEGQAMPLEHVVARALELEDS